MKVVNRTKLQSLMVEQGLSIKDIAEELCITYQGAYNKIRKNRDFSENEIYSLYLLFGSALFFDTLNDSKMRTNGKSKKKT